MMLRIAVTEEAGASRLDELYARYAPSAGRLAWLLTGDRYVAEDIVQEAFVRMFGRFRDIRQPESFEAYLRTTVVNLVRSRHRRLRTERDWLARQPREEAVAPAGPDPTERDRIWRALQTLPPRQRTAVVLRFYEDLSEAETAAVMRAPVGSVKSWVHRGLEKLRNEVGEDA